MGYNKKSKQVRCMEGPIKILARALDSYFRNMSSSGVHVFYGSSMSCPTPQLGSLPRNIGVSSFNSGYNTSSEEYPRPRSSSPMSRQDVVTPVPHGQSDQIGRFDDDKFSESGADHVLVVVHPKGICSAATRRQKIASVDHDFTTNVKYKRI